MIGLLAVSDQKVCAFSSPQSPPPPQLNSLPLPAKLAGGLFLFQRSIKPKDRKLSEEILQLSQTILRSDPLISMELGSGLEAGGVFSSSSSNDGKIHQLVMEFQINGGNSWAQARVHGVKILNDAAFLKSLEVSNMDAALMGGSVQVTIPPPISPPSDEPKVGNLE
jgi:hypothetical protein